jgi:hypothetical protein
MQLGTCQPAQSRLSHHDKMDHFSGMFDLGGRRGLGAGCKLPTAPPSAQQRCLNVEDLFGEYSLVSNQVQSEAGPPTGNIKFDLRKSAEQSSPFAPQMAANNTPTRGGGDGGLPAETLPTILPPGRTGANATIVHPMPHAQPRGPATATPAQIMPYSGFNKALKKWGMGNEVSIMQDLKWQKDIDGNAQKNKQFQDVVGGLQDFRTYLFIKSGSAFVMVLHLPMKFVAISKANQHLQGRLVGFVGDCTAKKDPTPIILSQQKTRKWETKTSSTDAMALNAYYTADPTRRGRLWVPNQAGTHKWTAVKAPLLLAIPLVLFKAIQEEGKLLMPHKIRDLIMALICEAANVAQAIAAWDLIVSWCILAAQQDMNGNSLLGLPVDAVMEGDDKYLAKWIGQ